MILINGVERQLKFNIYGIEKMQDKTDDKSSMANIYAMVYGGLEGNRYAKELDKDYSFEDVIDAVDALPTDARGKLAADITTMLTESQAFKSIVPAEDVQTIPDTAEEKKSEDTQT